MIWIGGADMGLSWLKPPQKNTRYVLANVHIPPALCNLEVGANGWCNADVLIEGRIISVTQAGDHIANETPRIDAGQSILLSALVDCHTHLDKAHVAAFSDFPSGDLLAAIDAMTENKKTWTAQSLQQRVEFSLQSAYAYGVRALRSHVDFGLEAQPFVWQVMLDAVQNWRGRIDLQLVPLVNILEFENPEIREAIYSAASDQGRVGMFLYNQPNLAMRLRKVFEHAKTNNWDIDLHVDEGLDPTLDGLNTVAKVALETNFTRTILCGHTAALSVYPLKRREHVIALAIKAGLHFVALPVTNLYLQGRGDDGVPNLRGMAPVARLIQSGATVSMGADNVRDGFCAFGDFDPISVLNLGAQMGHLDEPARDFTTLITRNPAASMGLDWDGRIVAGAPADLVLFAARNSGEMNLRANVERQVIRDGNWLDIQLPNMRELTG